jgi:hypothetical protein
VIAVCFVVAFGVVDGMQLVSGSSRAFLLLFAMLAALGVVRSSLVAPLLVMLAPLVGLLIGAARPSSPAS